MKKKIAQWIIDNPHYLIMFAKEFMISKNQIHRDLHDLKNEEDDLYIYSVEIFLRNMLKDLKIIIEKESTNGKRK